MLDQAFKTEPARKASCDGQKLSADVFGALINLSGRRRFTSQRVVLYAVLASMGHEGAIDTARDTLKQLRDAHTTLLHGKGSLPGIFCNQLHEAYFGTLQGDRVISIFLALADDTLEAIAGNTRGAPALLDELVRSATPLLLVLNGLTLVYEEQSMRHAQAQERELNAMLADIKIITKRARMIAFDAQLVAARAGEAGREFSLAARSMTTITAEIDDVVHAALTGKLAG